MRRSSLSTLRHSLTCDPRAGLERYKPSESKSTRTLGRFPMRNKFVADFIYETTGVKRTPKQVGSRIQQLRDTSAGKHSEYRPSPGGHARFAPGPMFIPLLIVTPVPLRSQS